MIHHVYNGGGNPRLHVPHIESYLTPVLLGLDTRVVYPYPRTEEGVEFNHVSTRDG